MSQPPISVLLPTYNCARTLRATLESVKWADEILVVDSYSSDGTLEVCREYGCRIIQHEYTNSAKQKNWAIPQCKHGWVLQIDSDEVLGPGLQEEITRTLSGVSSEVHAFRIPRRNYVLGKWVRHGDAYPDFQTRLMRRDLARWQDREVHAHVIVEADVSNLRTDLLHDDMPSIGKWLQKLDRYTRYEVDELRKKGVKFRWWDLLFRPPAAFLYRYAYRQGFRDGWRGLVVAGYWGVYVFFTRAKLWEAAQQQPSAAGQSQQPAPSCPPAESQREPMETIS